MLSVKVEDYGETEDQMHYVTYRVSDLSEKELDFLLNNLEGETIVEDGDLLLNIFYSRKFFPEENQIRHRSRRCAFQKTGSTEKLSLPPKAAASLLSNVKQAWPQASRTE